MKRFFCFSTCFMAFLPSAFSADQCEAIQTGITQSVQRLNDKLNADIAAAKSEVERGAESLKGELPDADKHPEVAINFFFDVRSHDQKIILHLPDVTIKDQTLILRLPDVTIKNQTWIWDRPVVRMVTVQTGVKPEFTCRDVRGGAPLYLPGIQCDTKFTPMYADVPRVEMAREQAILGVPEFSMRDQKIIMGIPEFSMREQTIVLRIPDFTLKKVSVETAKIKTRSEELTKQNKAATAKITDQFKADVEKVSLAGIAETFDCQSKNLATQESASMAELDKQIIVIESSYNKAKEVGATDLAAQMHKTLTDLIASRADAVKQFTMARNQLDASRKEALAKGGLTIASSKPANGAARPKPETYSFEHIIIE